MSTQRLMRLAVAIIALATSVAGGGNAFALDITGFNPNPVLVGGSMTLEGTGFGPGAGAMHIEYGSYADTTRPLGTLGPMEITSWTDTRIAFRLPTAINAEGRYWLRMRPHSSGGGGSGLLSTEYDGITFDVELPRPVISNYVKADVCPGSILQIRGSHFTRHRNAFRVMFVRIDSREYSILLNPDVVTGWRDNQIDIRLPNDLPGYVREGTRFRIELTKALNDPRRPGGQRIVARGPEGQLAEDCTTAQALPQQQFKPQLPDLPVLQFTLAPLRDKVPLGENVVFGGTFETTSQTLLRRLRETPVNVEWRIVGETNQLLARGNVQIRGRRTPLLVRAKPDKVGRYRLWLGLPPSAGEIRLRGSDLTQAWIEVYSVGTTGTVQPIPQQKPLPGGIKPQLQLGR